MRLTDRAIAASSCDCKNKYITSRRHTQCHISFNKKDNGNFNMHLVVLYVYHPSPINPETQITVSYVSYSLCIFSHICSFMKVAQTWCYSADFLCIRGRLTTYQRWRLETEGSLLSIYSSAVYTFLLIYTFYQMLHKPPKRGLGSLPSVPWQHVKSNVSFLQATAAVSRLTLQ